MRYYIGYHDYWFIIMFLNVNMIFLTFPASGAVALDDPEWLLQLVAVGEQVKQTLSVAGTVAQVDGDFSGRYTALAVPGLESV